jgi:regulation of enolase protein 1 (concanavalin A-like superfamily)
MFGERIVTLMMVILTSGFSLQAQMKNIDLRKFKSLDIGNPGLAGSTQIKADKVIITAGGADIWGVRDEFRFVYLKHSGDFDFAAQIENLTDPHLYTKAGLMAREDLSDKSRHIYFQVFPDNRARNHNNGGYEFQYRTETGGEMKAIYPPSAEGVPEFPVRYPDTWIRLKRDGNSFTGFYSNDGKSWKPFTTFTMDISGKLYLGLAVTSHNPKSSATATFSNISFLK